MIREKIEKLRNELYKNIEQYGIDSEAVKNKSREIDEITNKINTMQGENESYENIIKERTRKMIIF